MLKVILIQYTVFTRLEVTEELSKQKVHLEHQKKPFTGYIRFSDAARKITRQIPGRVNILKSPFPEDDRPIYRITSGQFSLIKHLFRGEGIDYEIVEWPEDVEKPFLMPPGF